MGSWGFLSNHGRVLLFLAHDPGMRLRDIAASLGITERTAFGIITDLIAAGYIRKRRTAAATTTRSRPTSRCRNPPAANGPWGKSWPCSPVQGAGLGPGQPSGEEGHR